MQVTTIADIKKMITDRKDDESIYAQVVAKDGSAWNMELQIDPLFGGEGIVITLRHEALETLPGLEEGEP